MRSIKAIKTLKQSMKIILKNTNFKSLNKIKMIQYHKQNIGKKYRLWKSMACVENVEKRLPFTDSIQIILF